jgi:hypothetical protein
MPVSLTTPPGVARPKGWVAACEGRARDRVDLDAPHRRQVDDEPVVDGRKASDVVAATTDGDEQVLLARELDSAGDVRGGHRPDDQCRMRVDHAVPDAAGFVEIGIGRFDDRAGDARAKRAGGLGGGRWESHSEIAFLGAHRAHG